MSADAPLPNICPPNVPLWKNPRLGIDCNQDQVVTSGDVALDYMHGQFAPGDGIYVIASQSLNDRVRDLGFAPSTATQRRCSSRLIADSTTAFQAARA